MSAIPPSPYPQSNMGPKPDNYLVWAILSTLFCCLPFGVVGIVYATQVNGKYESGDYQGAVATSENAKKWTIISAAAGGVVVLFYVVIFLIAAASQPS